MNISRRKLLAASPVVAAAPAIAIDFSNADLRAARDTYEGFGVLLNVEMHRLMRFVPRYLQNWLSRERRSCGCGFGYTPFNTESAMCGALWRAFRVPRSTVLYCMSTRGHLQGLAAPILRRFVNQSDPAFRRRCRLGDDQVTMTNGSRVLLIAGPVSADQLPIRTDATRTAVFDEGWEMSRPKEKKLEPSFSREEQDLVGEWLEQSADNIMITMHGQLEQIRGNRIELTRTK